jgi:hypothetical protein
MQKMTPQTQQKILAATDLVVDEVTAGASPNDAIIKVASDRHMLPGHIDVLVKAYNTGRTLEQIQAPTLADKTASFPLADTATVLKALFPEKPQSPAIAKRASAVSDDYLYPPTFMDTVRQHEIRQKYPMQKVADAPAKEPTWDDQFDMAEQMKRDTEELRRQQTVMAAELHSEFAKVAMALRQYGSPAFADVKDVLTTMWGDSGAAICNEIARRSPMLSKQASANKALAVDPRVDPWKSLHAIKSLAGRLAEVHTKYAASSAKLERLRGALFPKTASIMGSVGNAAAFQTTSGVLGGLAKSLSDTGPGVNSTMQKLQDPAHQQRLREIQTRANLDDLIAHDPVISGHEPADVLSAFNDLSTLAGPAISDRIVMQSLLRKHLQQGALDPFELDQLAAFGNRARPQQSSLMQQMGGGQGAARSA